MILRRVLLCILILSAPISSFAADSYFNANSIPPTLLPKPYADKSPQQKKELKYIIGVQKKADAEEVTKANAERHVTPEMFAESVIPALKRQNYPAVYALLDKVGDTSHDVTDVAKNYWHTNRPYIVDSKHVKALIEAHNNPAYPSGHTSGSYTWAHVMNLLLPGYSEDFYAKAESIAQHRVLVGMHFPNDVEGGKKLALLTVGGLLQNKEFLADLERAKQELKAKPVN